MPNWFKNYMLRHQHPASIALHVIGIPMTIAAVVLAGVQLSHGQWSLWWRPTLLLFLGFLLQWVGHKIEGNDMGELILIKKLRGKPYVAVSPRYQSSEHSP